MLTLAVILNLLVAAGMLGMGAKYIRAKPPMDYHANILSSVPVGDEVKMVLGALYKVMGGAFCALGAGTILLTLFGVWPDIFWAKLTILVMALISGYLATKVTKVAEDYTKVKTPWRIAAALTALAVIAFLVSLF